MTPYQAHLSAILQASRDDLVKKSTDIAFSSNDAPIPRVDVEQMMRACIAILEEGLAGEGREIRTGFLEAMPDLARSATLELTLRDGLACWGVIIGQLAAASSEQYRDEAVIFLSRFLGAWWNDALKAMIPVFIAEGTL